MVTQDRIRLIALLSMNVWFAPKAYRDVWWEKTKWRIDLNKKAGEIAELKFAVIAEEQGVIVSAPFGDSCEYDFVTDFNGNLSRVQIKSVWTKNTIKDRYATKVGKGKHKDFYDHVDVIAIYVDYKNTWYLIPTAEVEGKNICLYPHRKSDGMYERFRESWEVLK